MYYHFLNFNKNVLQTFAVPTSDSGVAVTMEPSMSPMKLEDYTSQRLVEPGAAEAEAPAMLGSPTGGWYNCVSLVVRVELLFVFLPCLSRFSEYLNTRPARP